MKKHYAYYDSRFFYGLTPFCHSKGNYHLFASSDEEVDCAKCKHLMDLRLQRIHEHNGRLGGDS